MNGDLAVAVARRFGFAARVRRLPDWGVGFLVTDVPGEADSQTPKSPVLQSAVWWQLVGLSGVRTRGRLAALRHLPESGVLHTLLRTGQLRSAKQYVQLLDLSAGAAVLAAELDEGAFDNLAQLEHGVRQIHVEARQRGVQLW
jgi:hypothetical protein